MTKTYIPKGIENKRHYEMCAEFVVEKAQRGETWKDTLRMMDSQQIDVPQNYEVHLSKIHKRNYKSPGYPSSTNRL